MPTPTPTTMPTTTTTTTQTTLETWGSFAAGLRADQVPASVRRRLRLQVASVLAATFSASADAGAEAITRWARRTPGPHPLLATGDKVARIEALIASSARSCALDFDDYCLVGHTGHSAVVVPLVLGAAADLSWSDLELAQTAAVELGARLGLATFLGPQNGQNLPFVHHAAAAVAAGRVLRLDARGHAHALALALAQPEAPLWPAFLGAHDGKILTPATATAHGVISAELAFEGVTGALDLLDHPRGFLHRFAFVPARGALGRLGEVWLADTLHVKEHPACAYFQTAIDAAIEVAAQARAILGRPLVMADVKSIEIETTLLGAAVDAHARLSHGAHAGSRDTNAPLRPNEVSFSLSLTTALALLGAGLRPAAFAERPLAARSADARALAARTSVRHAWDLTSQLVFRVGSALGVRALFAGTDPRAILAGVLQARSAFPELDLAISPAHLATDLIRLVEAAVRPNGETLPGVFAPGALEGVGFPFATRLHVTLEGGARLGADRAYPRGAPGRPFDEAETIARDKLVEAASEPLGRRRANKLADAVLDPLRSQKVRDVVALLTRK
jgi:2-methylcitrate dehydratase PrpD